jgi:Tfp pilus assembly protein PilN
MSVRVNLLKPQEVQQQSAVSRDLLVRGATFLGTGAAVLGIAFMVLQYRETGSTHRRLKAAWADMETEYKAVKEIADKQAANMGYVAELESWSHSRLEWEAPLNALQELVPDNLQLTRLAIASDVVISKAEPTTDKYVGTPARTYTMQVEGRAVGALSDQDVIAFVEGLQKSLAISPWLDSVRLQGMQRVSSQGGEGGEGGEEARLFRVNAASQERLMK